MRLFHIENLELRESLLNRAAEARACYLKFGAGLMAVSVWAPTRSVAIGWITREQIEHGMLGRERLAIDLFCLALEGIDFEREVLLFLTGSGFDGSLVKTTVPSSSVRVDEVPGIAGLPS
jgi:hypothetical protein